MEAMRYVLAVQGCPTLGREDEAPPLSPPVLAGQQPILKLTRAIFLERGTATGGWGTVRRDLAVFGSTGWSSPSSRERWSRTRIVPSSRFASCHRSPSASPCRTPTARATVESAANRCPRTASNSAPGREPSRWLLRARCPRLRQHRHVPSHQSAFHGSTESVSQRSRSCPRVWRWGVTGTPSWWARWAARSFRGTSL